MVASTMRLLPYRVALQNAANQLVAGEPVWQSLKDVEDIPEDMVVLVRVGEESGRLSEALENLANSYDADTEDRMAAVGSLLEPILIVVIGLVVGFVLVAMYLPLFSLGSQV